MQPTQPAPGLTPTPSGNYDFIFNPQQSQSQRTSLPGSNSMLKRVAIVGVGLLILLIIFVVLKSVLSGSGNFPTLLSVAQDQQEIIHLVTNAQQPSNQTVALTTDNQNFAGTTRLTTSSAQSGLITYLRNNGHKVSGKQLNLKVSNSVDNQLTAAKSDSSLYNQTFQQVMQTELQRYRQDLSAAYKLTTGPKGRALLNADYNSAGLLLTQMTSPAS